jgi:hypothetical protein
VKATREEIAELKVSDFVLGMLFEKPFTAFAQVYRGYGVEVRPAAWWRRCEGIERD